MLPEFTAPNSVFVGQVVSCVVRVQNDASESDARVALTAEIPDGMTPEPIAIDSLSEFERTTDFFIAKYTIDSRTIRFVNVPQFAPSTILTYRFRVRADRPGAFTIRVNLTSEKQARPLTREATIRVQDVTSSKTDNAP